MDFAVQRAINKYNMFPCRFPMFGGFTSRKKRTSSAIPRNVDVWSDIRPSWVIAVIAKPNQFPFKTWQPAASFCIKIIWFASF